MTTLTIIVPAYNEADGLAKTLDSLLAQTVPADRIIVVNDYSTDDTLKIATLYAKRGIEVLTPPQNLGSKAKAQNFVLPHVDTDLVLPIDGDTTLDPDYVEKLLPFFDDPLVSVASGCVLTQRQESLWEKARQLEYLFGFHFYRSIQQSVNSITVCSGCCTVFRREFLVEGFPETTLTEDIYYTWNQHIAGRKAVYVHDAIARAAEPVNFMYMNKQLKRWKCGWFHGFRLQFWQLAKNKPMVALWAMLQFLETSLAPVVIALPFVAYFAWDVSLIEVILWWLLGDLITFWPPVIYGCWKRKYPLWRAIVSYPTWYMLKAINVRWDVHMCVREMILVPLGLRKPFTVYERGKA
ncbi:MAG TPA: glycosyltransferase family 2 protein [Verrucomicrobiae bacterium]|nr:glycosyltransferase family 2 protein [Verrucomicrobiae bacterium]